MNTIVTEHRVCSRLSETQLISVQLKIIHRQCKVMHFKIKDIVGNTEFSNLIPITQNSPLISIYIHLQTSSRLMYLHLLLSWLQCVRLVYVEMRSKRGRRIFQTETCSLSICSARTSQLNGTHT